MSRVLFSDHGCPFAHRVLALLDHLALDFEHREGRIGDKPPGLVHYSPTGRIPLLVDDDVVLTESRVILEHLADVAGWAAAWPADPVARSLHRHAMALMDAHLLDDIRRDTPDARRPRALEALEHLERIVAITPPEPSLLALHLGPSWVHLARFGPSFVAGAVRGRPVLHAWLDAAAALPCVRRTAPDVERVRADLARVAS